MDLRALTANELVGTEGIGGPAAMRFAQTVKAPGSKAPPGAFSTHLGSTRPIARLKTQSHAACSIVICGCVGRSLLFGCARSGLAEQERKVLDHVRWEQRPACGDAAAGTSSHEKEAPRTRKACGAQCDLPVWRQRRSTTQNRHNR